MLPHQLQYAQFKFRQLVTESTGTKFEDLFHRMMELCDGNYAPIRTSGNLGDQGADGLGLAGRELYACYGPDVANPSKIKSKFRKDLNSALRQRPGQFDTFVFVHNDLRGIHPIVGTLLGEAGQAHPNIGFQQMGARKMWHKAMRLDLVAMEDLLGETIPVELVVYSIGMAEVEPLLAHLAEQRQSAMDQPIPTPSPYKADFNKLGTRFKEMLQRGRRYQHLIDSYYRGVIDKTERDEVAAGFRAYYELLRVEHGNDFDEIFWQLQGYVCGQARPTLVVEEAAEAVLSYFFDLCDIFEIPPQGWAPAIGAHGGVP